MYAGLAPTVVRRKTLFDAEEEELCECDPPLYPWDGALPVKTEPMSRPAGPLETAEELNPDGFPLPSTALCSALLIDVIQFFMSSSDVAW